MRAILISVFAIFTIARGQLVQTPETCIVRKTGQPGDCIIIQQCPVLYEAFQRFREIPTVCNFVTRAVCCPRKNPTATTTSTTTTKAPLRISAKKCREYGEYIYERHTVNSLVIGDPSVEKIVRKCNHEAVPLIVGGDEAKEGEFPHMTLIGFGEGKRDEDYQCGGSLVSEQWILSAAHCISTGGLTANFAKVGNVIRDRETANSWKHEIVERIPHPDYSSRFADNDIALFKLKQPALLNTNVIPICLPDRELLTTKAAIATGFGRTGFAEDVSGTLMKVIIDYFSPDICNTAFEDSNRFANNQIDWSKMVCAGSHNKSGDTCNGDSGGPLQIYNSDVYCMYKIIGVTSFGSAYCGFPGVPAIYTKVFHYIDWIEGIVWPNQ